MALETFPFDVAPFFATEEAQAELLNDALESGHAAYIAHVRGVIARAREMKGRLASHCQG